ncbi:rubredoxin-like domain-containing protein, partial [Gordonibacter pamelaeae]
PGRPKVAWRCTVCGHMVYEDELPDDFACPVCGVGKDMFERVEL